MTIKASPIKQHSFCSFIWSNCSSIASNGYSKNLTPGLLSEAAYKELESTMITVIHDKIFDIFALYFGKRIPKTILTHGSGTFIAERFLFESIEKDCDDLKIVLPSELESSNTSLKTSSNF
jgi:hypothetical protein